MTSLRRLVTLALFLLSVATGGRLLWGVIHDPLWQPLVAASEAQVAAALDRALAAQSTPDRLTARIETLLVQDPRNWAALDSLESLAQTRGIALSPALQTALEAARAEDTGWMAQTAACAACAWDVAECPLDGTLLCQGAVVMTPLPDVAGVSRAAANWLSGEPIDRFDLTLSVVGLTATAAVLVSGGSSATVKAGAGALRMARGMGRLSGRFMDLVLTVSARAIDMPLLARGDLRAAVRVEELAPLVKIATHAEELSEATGLGGLVHLLPLIDDAQDAERLARVGKVAGKETLALAEILGKARLMRVTLRWSARLVEALGGFALLLGALTSALSHLVTSRLRRALR